MGADSYAKLDSTTGVGETPSKAPGEESSSINTRQSSYSTLPHHGNKKTSCCTRFLNVILPARPKWFRIVVAAFYIIVLVVILAIIAFVSYIAGANAVIGVGYVLNDYKAPSKASSLYDATWTNNEASSSTNPQFRSNPLGPSQLVVQWDSQSSTLSVLSASNETLWSTRSGRAFLAAYQDEIQDLGNFGNIRIIQDIKARTRNQLVSSVTIGTDSFVLSGTLNNPSDDCTLSYDLSFTVSPQFSHTLDMNLDVKPNASACEIYNVIAFSQMADKKEKFMGVGEQFSFLDLAGNLVPIVTREQGMGHGMQPTTAILNVFLSFAGGDHFTTYTATPHYTTSLGRSFYLGRNVYDFAAFDFRDSKEATVIVRRTSNIRAGLILGTTPLEAITEYTAHVGRMPQPPEWVAKGVIVGIQGGESKIHDAVERMLARNISVGGLWIQDWVGRRLQRVLGVDQYRLWHHWENDNILYPNWPEFVKNITEQKIQILAYVNNFVADVKGGGKPEGSWTRWLFGEARDQGFLFMDENGEPLIKNSGPNFDLGILDITNPGAREWFKALIKKNLIDVGVRGWMADFGESSPYDGYFNSTNITFTMPIDGENVTVDSLNANILHNFYPSEWARLNRELVREAGVENETLIFMRSANQISHQFAGMYWTGDQYPVFDDNDGMRSTLVAILSSGLSGYAFQHSDVGGYTNIAYTFLPGIYFSRDTETLQRWMELSVFSSLWRSHEGSIPAMNKQPYDEDMLDQLSLTARLYVSLAEYRLSLYDEATRLGYPVSRAMFLHYPDESEAWNLEKVTTQQFLFGPSIVAAPVIRKGDRKRSAWVPPGEWVYPWTGEVVTGPTWVKVDAPIGRIPCWVVKNEWENENSTLAAFRSEIAQIIA